MFTECLSTILNLVSFAITRAAGPNDPPEPKSQVEAALTRAYPPVIRQAEDIQNWQTEIGGVKTPQQGFIVGELIRSGVIKSPDEIDRYAWVWQSAFDPGRACLFFQETPAFDDLDELIAEVLFEKIPAVAAGEAGVEDFLLSIPSRAVLENLLFGKQGEVIQQLLAENWPLIGPFLGHIIYGEDKNSFHAALEKTLKEQKIDPQRPSFYAPVFTIDLNTLERRIHPAQIRVIDADRVLYIIEVDDTLFAGVINPRDTSTMKQLLRAAFPQEEQYLLAYYPKLEYSPASPDPIGASWRIGSSYEKRDRFLENLLGKNDFANNLDPALDNFQAAYAQEDSFKVEEKNQFQNLIDVPLLEKIKAEPPLALDGILKLMLIMADHNCRKDAPAIFGISPEAYQSYEDQVVRYLDQAREISREELLVEAVRICEGRIALAAIICYNLLLPLGEIGNNALFTRFPKALKMLPDIQDQAGSIYHFFGCFFAAYSLQRWMVNRYYTDPGFKAQLDRQEVQLTDQIKNGRGWKKYLFVLLAAQIKYLRLNGSSGKEIMSLAGVFFEEVIEDRELSKETSQDLRGVAAGHAVYELVSDSILDNNGFMRGWAIKTMRNFAVSGFDALKNAFPLNLIY